MTISECLAFIKKFRPSAIDDAQMVEWLSNLDRRVYYECVKPYEDRLEELPEEERTKEPRYRIRDLNVMLMIPGPWDEIYHHWIDAQYRYWYGEDERYNIAMAKVQDLYEDYKQHYLREHGGGDIRLKFWG